MRRLLVALALAATALAPAPAGADASAYSSPANLGVHHPFGAPIAFESEPIDFSARHPFSAFTVEAHDWLGYDVWIKVCLRYSGGCIRTVEGEDRVVVEAPLGTTYPTNMGARVYVYAIHAWADGEASLSTWGGVRAQFEPEPVVYDIVPYAAAGYGGQVGSLLPVNVRVECGSYLSAQCATAPITASKVRVTVVDELVSPTYFESCLFRPDGSQIQCVPATNLAQMVGIPAGGMVDVRPYNALGSEIVGTKGYVLIQYVV